MWSKILDNSGLIGAVIAAAISWGTLKSEVNMHSTRMDKQEARHEQLEDTTNRLTVTAARIEQKVDDLRCDVAGKGCGR